MRIAMLSYNSILPDEDNGWVRDTLYMIQSDRGITHGVPQSVHGTLEELRQVRYEGIDQVQDAVRNHWTQLGELLPKLDKVVIYVGDSGSEHTISYAAEHGLSADKAMFVLCSCNQHDKRRLIKESGFGESSVIMCECSGRQTMARLATKFLETGTLPA